MTSLARIQAAFQRAVLGDDTAILDELCDGANEGRAALLGVYRDTHELRLREAMHNQQAVLRAYLGDPAFEALAGAYIAAVPSRDPSLRRFTRGLPAFLAADPAYAARPALADIARLAIARDAAFDAPGAVAVRPADLDAPTPAAIAWSMVRPHPSAKRLDLVSNAADIWTATESGAPLPAEMVRPASSALIVWRRHATIAMRTLHPDEAALWDLVARGAHAESRPSRQSEDDFGTGRIHDIVCTWAREGLLAATPEEDIVTVTG